MKVLLADDSQLILDRLQELLHVYKDAEIIGSLKNGSDALEAIRALEPDLVIIDINMPGLNGLQVLDIIKKEDHKTKFIVLTFYATDYYRKKAIKLGTDYFFSKSDDFEKVSVVVNNLLIQESNNNLIMN
ncbi:MAG: response regulator [Prolixibacteraceae bacterium]|nr:response regulator [Prolixibacteraceae bacterium]MBT6763178.1 response regulator [Prolixibacteraceae bacterium]MBT6998381.1 response regulator [Prolixibacteraceae bacterium]MBT7394100.1 response regulator [Prolixibacteraceae bacterium]